MPHLSPESPYQLFVGVDVAVTTATAAWQVPKQKPSQAVTFEQTLEGFSSLHRHLMETGTLPKTSKNQRD